MAQYRPFAHWDGTSALPSGISQSQNILVGVENQNYYNLGGLTWWAGPDESLGYVIAYSDPTLTHPNPLDIPCGIGFLRSDALTDVSFLETFNYLMAKLSQPTLSNANNAKAWLLANGYWTSFGESPWAYGNSSNTPSAPGINQTLYWEGGNPISVATEFAINANNTNQFSQIQNIYVNEISADINGNPAGNQGTFLMGLPAGTLIEITNTIYPTQNVIVEVVGVSQLTSTSYSISVNYVSGSATGGQQVFEFHFYSPNQNNNGGGVGEWYFYSDEGPLNAMAPEGNGNAIFLINNPAGGPGIETFNPNTAEVLYFSTKDASGVSHLTEFQDLITYGGTIMIEQNGDIVEYNDSPNGGGFQVMTSPAGGFIQINPALATIGQPAANSFVYADPISISISI
jgi:hypothetical protein